MGIGAVGSEEMMVRMVIDQLMARGIVEAFLLYEAPFNTVHAGGPMHCLPGRKVSLRESSKNWKPLEPG